MADAGTVQRDQSDVELFRCPPRRRGDLAGAARSAVEPEDHPTVRGTVLSEPDASSSPQPVDPLEPRFGHGHRCSLPRTRHRHQAGEGATGAQGQHSRGCVRSAATPVGSPVAVSRSGSSPLFRLQPSARSCALVAGHAFRPVVPDSRLPPHHMGRSGPRFARRQPPVQGERGPHRAVTGRAGPQPQ